MTYLLIYYLKFMICHHVSCVSEEMFVIVKSHIRGLWSTPRLPEGPIGKETGRDSSSIVRDHIQSEGSEIQTPLC